MVLYLRQSLIRHFKAGFSTSRSEPKKYNVVFDETGKYLLLHHHSAGRYYKMNIAFFSIFFSISLYHTYYTPEVFFNKSWVSKLYMGALTGAFMTMYAFSNRHIRNLYLMKGGKQIAVETYSNFGLTYNCLRLIPIEQLTGNRLFMKREMNVY